MGSALAAAYQVEHEKYVGAKSRSDDSEMWLRLERMHILGQSDLKMHFCTHLLMLKEAVWARRPHEVLGQVLRLLLVVPGHITGLLPKGNVGTVRVSGFTPMETPEDLRGFFDQKSS